jgi:hypothetical protein
VLPIRRATSFIEAVPLPQLQRIRLEGDIDPVVIVLDHISFPRTTTMHFICLLSSADSSTMMEKTPLLSILSKIRTRLSDTSSTETQVKPSTLNISSTYAELRFVAGNSYDSRTYLSSPKPWLELVLKASNLVSSKKGELAGKILETLCPLTFVRHLTLDAPGNFFSVKNFSKSIASLKQVQVFHLEGSCVMDVFKGLMQVRRNRVTIFPSMKVLTLTGVDFDPEREEEYEVVDKLKDLLMLRYEAKAEITGLSLKACKRLSSDDVEELKDICVSVKWDELEDFEDEDEDEDFCDDMNSDYSDDDIMPYFPGPYLGHWWYV